ncbi:MAG: UDP-3-O-(3-hydroxymyristoyl)glucosamine N-acyltransferase [Gammaproteobacteria bacterium]|nr:UDP-3-O-(3-hydroxymyristoyl)glucosamine N-acyltransferase [Gammaproteobacteria bacterium]
MPLSLQQLADQLDHRFQGDADLVIHGVASLTSAQTGDLCFLQHKKYLSQLDQSRCSVLIVPDDFDNLLTNKSIIYSPDPQFSFARAIPLLTPPEVLGNKISGIHPSAQIAESATLGEGVSIGALSVIGENTVIGTGTKIAAGCIIEDNVRLGRDCLLHSRVTVAYRVVIGDRCIFHSGVVLGSDGFGLALVNHEWQKIPQIGTVIIGDDVEIGANTTVDRGAVDDTIIEEGCKLDNLIQVAHNVRIGAHTAIAACVGIAGSANIGRYCRISGAAVVLGHLSVADHVTVNAMSMVTKDIKQAGVYSSSTPLMESSEWRKNNARIKSLDKLARKVAELEQRSRMPE